jgi:hypothetical protein
MRMTSMISSPVQPQTGGFSQNDLFRGFSSIGNKVSSKRYALKLAVDLLFSPLFPVIR